MSGSGPTPIKDSEDAALLQKQGNAHEEAHLQKLKKAGRRIVEIKQGRLEDDAQLTREALATGPDVLYQGAFLQNGWGGWSDFLEPVETPSELGSFSYEVPDTKIRAPNRSLESSLWEWFIRVFLSERLF